MAVYEFKPRAPAEEPAEGHLSGRARCACCTHEWVAVVPAGAGVGVTLGANALECPACKANKGVLLDFIQLPTGSLQFTCLACEGNLFLITKTPGTDQPYSICASCGTTAFLMEAFT